MDAPLVTGRSWIAEARGRCKVWRLTKMWGTILGISSFFVAYFWALHNPLTAVTVMPITLLDRLVPFQPEFLILYLSLWLYISLVPALIVRKSELLTYLVGATLLAVIGITFFIVWPTKVVWPAEYWNDHFFIAFLRQFDASGNACPSLHVAYAIFSACWLHRQLAEMGAGRAVKILNWLWALGIAFSTVAVRQHVLIDLIAGALLGAAVIAAEPLVLRTITRIVSPSARLESRSA